METVFEQIKSESFGNSRCQYRRYSNADFVARGRFGTVYETTVRGRSMVVKVFHLNKYKKPLNGIETWTNWRNRMKILPDLDHTNLVRYHKFTIIKARGGVSVELLMDYCRGGDLAVFLQRLASSKVLLDETTAVRYALEVAEGLSYLHEKNIIHGDLKPGNVLVREVANGENSLVICDLDDFVQMKGNQTCTDDISHLRGTYRYMSPEMLRTFGSPPAEERPGRKTDVWSLGCIILALAERVVGIDERWLQKDQTIIPAGDKISDEIYTIKVIDGFAPLCPDSVPQELRQCIERCLCESVDKRYTAPEIVIHLYVWTDTPNPTASNQKAPTKTGSALRATQRFRKIYQLGGRLFRAGETEQPSGPAQLDFVELQETFGRCSEYSFSPKDCIARGTFGVVYAGRIKQGVDCHHCYGVEARVAIKVVHISMSEISLDLQGWKERLQLLYFLRHDHLLAYHTISISKFQAAGTIELVMDYYGGGTLESVLRGLKVTGSLLDVAEAFNFATEITDGLEFLHRSNIIHADLCPSSILLKQIENGQKRLAMVASIT